MIVTYESLLKRRLKMAKTSMGLEENIAGIKNLLLWSKSFTYEALTDLLLKR